MNKKLTQKDFDNFKESIEDLIKLYKESRLSKIENNKESEEVSQIKKIRSRVKTWRRRSSSRSRKNKGEKAN
ncbi:hypothetical protein [Saccharolobus solfataricus]|uniref:hypothetical protein n=1 Tax=Saccharolobus solfataricus TaxID=2287 RepID=UPI001EE8CEC9|nr:hypothetical protein [Saccharolobus solfataricus]